MGEITCVFIGGFSIGGCAIYCLNGCIGRECSSILVSLEVEKRTNEKGLSYEILFTSVGVGEIN